MTPAWLANYHASPRYRWLLLVLCAVTATLVITLPNMSLPPLFSTISQELGMSLVQEGLVWGVASFTGIFIALIGGTLGDQYGARRMLFLSCLLAGLAGLARAFAQDFAMLLVASFCYGLFGTITPIILFKVARDWFPAQQLGMASGIISAGFATGLMLGPLLSTSVILPALGGWRQVLAFYGVVAMLFALVWWFAHPPQAQKNAATGQKLTLQDRLGYIIRLRSMWLLSLGGLGIAACQQGFSGYLPSYLKSIGWANLDADRALSAFFLTSLIAVIPLSTLADRLRWRRGYLLFAALVLGVGIGLVSVVSPVWIVPLLALTGFVFDTFMALLNASVLEADELSPLYAGTAVGFAVMVRSIGGAISPPLGNSLAAISPSTPFLFWGAMGLLAMLFFWLLPRRSTAVV